MALSEAQSGADGADDEIKVPTFNRPAPNTSYFTPLQSPVAGTATVPQPEGRAIPKLFQPLTIRGLTLQNRIMVSPMCQYSAENGHLTSWHMAHLGGMLLRGPGLTMIEATGVSAVGRITAGCSGLWQDSQIEPIRRIVEFAHSQGQKIGIQLGHAGRKGSTNPPWLSGARDLAAPEAGGWPSDVVGPSAQPWNAAHADPRALSLQDIDGFKADWARAVTRALTAGVDVIEIHAAHGYLLNSFLSPAVNTRTDRYGGSFENRTRLVREVAAATRALIPDAMPLFLRISATDWLEERAHANHGWTSADTVRLAPILAALGVDLLDVSSGGNHEDQHPHARPGYQVPFAEAVKRQVGDSLLVATVGEISSGKQANDILENSNLDVVAAATAFLQDPSLVWTWARELGVHIRLANQIRWAFE